MLLMEWRSWENRVFLFDLTIRWGQRRFPWVAWQYDKALFWGNSPGSTGCDVVEQGKATWKGPTAGIRIGDGTPLFGHCTSIFSGLTAPAGEQILLPLKRWGSSSLQSSNTSLPLLPLPSRRLHSSADKSEENHCSFYYKVNIPGENSITE